ncbi:MAG: hypothetical protein M0Q38_01950 [Bacteroidales bacterium]|nr:hypothetical protein [Bacteroidales bacterium]
MVSLFKSTFFDFMLSFSYKDKTFGKRLQERSENFEEDKTGCMVASFQMLDTGCWIQDAGCRMQDARYSIQETGCWIQDAGCRMQDTGYWMLDTGYRMLDAGCKIQDNGYWINNIKGD